MSQRNNTIKKFYESRIYARRSSSVLEDIGVKKTLNSFKEPLYGLADKSNLSLVLSSESRLKEIDLKGNRVLDFVADAYNDFIKYFNFNRTLSAESPFLFNLKVVDSYQPVTNSYFLYMQELAKFFLGEYLVNSKLDTRLTNFNCFIKLFLEYVEANIGDIPILLSDFNISKNRNILSSGLTLEISDGDKNDNNLKLKYFYKDPNFEFYIQALKKYGFIIDINCPWLIVADLSNNSNIRSYFNKINLDLSNSNNTNLVDLILNTYYSKAYLLDLNLLVSIIFQLYTSYVTSNPFLTRKKQKIQRQVFSSFEEFKERYNNEYWLKIYVKLKLLSVYHEVEESRLNNIITQALYLNKFLSLDKALDYTNNTVMK